MEDFTIPFNCHLSRLLKLFLPEQFKGHAQTQTTYPQDQAAWTRGRCLHSADTWNSTHCSGELAKSDSFCFLKNKCTSDSSSKVHLFTKFTQSQATCSCFCFYKEKGKG